MKRTTQRHPGKPSRARAFALAASAAMLVAHAAHAQDDLRVLVDRDLQPRAIRLVSVSNDTIEYEDEQGRIRRATVGGLVALLPADPEYGQPDASLPPTRSKNPLGHIELTDGQRFPGTHATTGGDEDAVIWTHPRFGRISVLLDNVASVVLDAGIKHGDDDNKDTQRVDDRVTLINGDTLDGFLVSLGDPVEIEIDGQTLTIPPERVASVEMGAMRTPLQGIVVWLDDGTVAVVAQMESRNGSVDMTLPGGQRAGYSLSSLRAVAFEAGSLRPLSSLRVIDQTPIGRRTLLETMHIDDNRIASLSAPDIELPGPMLVRWELPAGARRFAAIADMPIDAHPWGDAELVIRIAGKEVIRERLHQGHPRIEFSLPIEPSRSTRSRTLEISLEPGNFGPINDRVILRRPMLLIDPNE